MDRFVRSGRDVNLAPWQGIEENTSDKNNLGVWALCVKGMMECILMES